MTGARFLGGVVLAASLVAACGSEDAATPTTASTASTTRVQSDAGSATAAPTTGSAPSESASTQDGEPAPAADPSATFTEIASLEAPVDLAWRADDAGLYVVEQGGRIVRLADGAPAEVLDVSEQIVTGGEQGLLGLAFAPAGDLAYVNYTNPDGDTTIAEHEVDADGQFVAEGRVLFVIEQPYPNHNGGDLAFGPDGLLYVGMGDGGSADDPERRATDLASPLGKMLRVDPAPTAGEQFTVPPDNPFVGQEDADPRIWSSGLRNPWRFSFDRQTGDLWIADVGQNEFEEIDVAPATNGVDAGKGVNFGWSAYEGFARFNNDVDDAGHVPPLQVYDHSDGGCSISGGVRVRDGTNLDGWYVYADYCLGQVSAQQVNGGDGEAFTAGPALELGNVPSPTAVVEGPNAEVYVLSAEGPVIRLDPA